MQNMREIRERTKRQNVGESQKTEERTEDGKDGEMKGKTEVEGGKYPGCTGKGWKERVVAGERKENSRKKRGE